MSGARLASSRRSVLAQHRLGRGAGACQHQGGFRPLGPALLTSRERQEIAHDGPAASGLIRDGLQRLPLVTRPGAVGLQVLRQMQDGGERVVELVGDAGGDSADGGQALVLERLALGALELPRTHCGGCPRRCAPDPPCDRRRAPARPPRRRGRSRPARRPPRPGPSAPQLRANGRSEARCSGPTPRPAAARSPGPPARQRPRCAPPRPARSRSPGAARPPRRPRRRRPAAHPAGGGRPPPCAPRRGSRTSPGPAAGSPRSRCVPRRTAPSPRPGPR